MSLTAVYDTTEVENQYTNEDTWSYPILAGNWNSATTPLHVLKGSFPDISGSMSTLAPRQMITASYSSAYFRMQSLPHQETALNSWLTDKWQYIRKSTNFTATNDIKGQKNSNDTSTASQSDKVFIYIIIQLNISEYKLNFANFLSSRNKNLGVCRSSESPFIVSSSLLQDAAVTIAKQIS